MSGHKIESGLKIYRASKAERSEWIVSGPAKITGKRWRRRFKNKELAEEFYNREAEKLNSERGTPGRFIDLPFKLKNANCPPETFGSSGTGCYKKTEEEIGECHNVYSRNTYGYKSVASDSRRRSTSGMGAVLLTVSVVLLGYAVDRKFLPPTVPEKSIPIRADFEANPLLSGWRSSGPGAEWTDAERVSGRAAISVSGGTWESPVVNGNVGEWYRLAFRSKGPNNELSLRKTAPRGCAIAFTDGNGEPAGLSLGFDVHQASRWQMNEFWFRSQVLIDTNGNLRPTNLRIQLYADKRNQFFADEIILERATVAQVAKWADGVYGNFPSPLTYNPDGNRWERIPSFMAKLSGHQKVRILVVGDEMQRELANAPIDLFIERSYPGSAVEVIAVGESEMRLDGTRWNLTSLIMSYKADLLILGGMLSVADVPLLQELVHAVRANDIATRRKTEMLVLTSGWRSDTVRKDGSRFSSDMRELNQAVAKNPTVPNDMRGQLLKFAAANEIEFLDLMGILSEYIFSAASEAKAGPGTGADGVPYGFWTRDWIHPAEVGKHLMARILESYMAPKSAAAEGRDTRKQIPKKARGDMLARDLNLAGEARKRFQVSPLERPIFVKSFDNDLTVGHEDVRGGKPVTFRLGSDARKESGFNFDQPADLRQGDVAVYWSFCSDRSAGEERSKVGMHLCFTDPGKGERHDRAQVSLIVRPGGVSILGVGGELLEEQSVEHPVEVPVENFVDATTEAKFRLILRWTGGDRVVVEAASWSPRSKRWEGFIPHDRPGAPPLTMELSILKNLMGTAAFKSIFFESASNVPKLGTVLVTVRPSLVR